MVAPGIEASQGLPGRLNPECLSTLRGIAVVAHWGTEEETLAVRRALAAREGPLIPLVSGGDLESYCVHERHTCIDTTAAGGNASLLAGDSD
jgi:RHH-type proline utilization regulon transcriptional repressor/proline dehydrogenase/delta 1-pyrroline-5-carboxylate dehydrogenase